MFETIKAIINFQKTTKICKQLNYTMHQSLIEDGDVDNLMSQFKEISDLLQKNELLFNKSIEIIDGKKPKKTASILHGLALSACAEGVGIFYFLNGQWDKFNEVNGYYNQKLSSAFLRLNLSDIQLEKMSTLMHTMNEQTEKGQQMALLRKTLIQIESEPDNEELKVVMQQLKAYFYNSKGFTKCEFTAEKMLVELYLGNPDRAYQESLVLLDSKEKNQSLIEYEININSSINNTEIGQKFFAILYKLLEIEPSVNNSNSTNAKLKV